MGLGVDHVPGDAAAQVGVGDAALVVEADVLLGEVGDRRAATHHPASALAGALVLQQALADRPAAVQGADHVVLLDPGVGEEGLAERAVAGDQLDRPGFDAGLVHIDQHEGDALVLLGLGVGAHQAEAPVGVLGAGGPDLLAVDDPVVAGVLALGLQGGEVGARAGFGIASASFTMDASRDL